MGEEEKKAGAGGEEEEKGCWDSFKEGVGNCFLGIAGAILWIIQMIINIFWGIGQCLEFIWYPIKENCAKCCRWCGNKRQRSNDPTYSTFDNEV